MKSMILAAATILAVSAGAAYADGEGGPHNDGAVSNRSYATQQSPSRHASANWTQRSMEGGFGNG